MPDDEGGENLKPEVAQPTSKVVQQKTEMGIESSA